MRAIPVVVLIIGIVIAIAGGFIEGETWFRVGAVIAIIGVCALWGLATLKDPMATFKADAEVEAMASGVPPTVAHPSQFPVPSAIQANALSSPLRKDAPVGKE